MHPSDETSEPVAAATKRRGRPPALSEAEQQRLTAFVREHPSARVVELAEGFSGLIGRRIAPQTLHNHLRRLGIVSIRPPRSGTKPTDSTPVKDDGGSQVPVRYRKPVDVPESSHRASYPTDITDAEWSLIEPLLSKRDTRGRRREVSLREVLNALRYQARSGCQWRLLPHDFPRWDVVAKYYYRWSHTGLWDEINDHLRRLARAKEGREPEPTAGIIDSQSVKTTEVPSERGYDAGKKVKGRKRHILVDVLGLLLVVVVHSAGLQDREAAPLVLNAQTTQKFPNLSLVWADGGYSGKVINEVRETSGIELEIVKRPRTSTWVPSPDSAQEGTSPPTGFTVLPHRWIVERTLAWIGRYRRLSKDYERSERSAQTWILIGMTSTVLRRWWGA